MNSRKAEAWSGGRLLSIDALRGIAALGVVLYHAVGRETVTMPHSLWQWPGFFVRTLTSFGYVGVFLFFVISGFCIHMQWARAQAAGQAQQIRFGTFWKRRLRRLYPAYLIALALYLLATFLSVGYPLTGANLYDVLLHLTMLHNLDPKTVYSINAVFWTLAIEEQLYLAYFLLLFLRRRFGWGLTLVVCVASRVGWFYFSHAIWVFFGVGVPVPEASASHWLTWALGAVSVEAACGLIKLPRWCRSLWVAAGALSVAVVFSQITPHIDKDSFTARFFWLALHPAWGLAFFVIVNRAFGAEAKSRARWGADLGLSRGSQFHPRRLIALTASLGVFSYSLYLTHGLVILESWRFGAQPLPLLIDSLFVTTPVCIAFAWIFFQFCEAPFMSKPVVKLASVVLCET